MLVKSVECGAAVDEHLQDQVYFYDFLERFSHFLMTRMGFCLRFSQLIIFMALAKGHSRYLSGPLSLHTQTAIHICQLMLGVKFDVKTLDQGNVIVECDGMGFERVTSDGEAAARWLHVSSRSSFFKSTWWFFFPFSFFHIRSFWCCYTISLLFTKLHQRHTGVRVRSALCKWRHLETVWKVDWLKILFIHMVSQMPQNKLHSVRCVDAEISPIFFCFCLGFFMISMKKCNCWQFLGYFWSIILRGPL